MAGLALALAPAWWTAVRSGQGLPVAGAPSLVPLVAMVLAIALVRREPRGPLIHDRQTDVILACAAGAGAVELLRLGQRAGSGSFVMAGAACLMAVAIVAAGWGTRALWQVRWAIALLLLTWRVPWAVATEVVWPVARSLAQRIGDLLPGVSPLGTGRVAVSVGTSPVALDPADGGSVLYLVFAGVLVGLAYSSVQRGRRRSALSVLVGVGAGVVLAAVTWLVAVCVTLMGGAASARIWSTGQLVAAVAVLSAGVMCLVSYRSSRRRTRETLRPSSTARSRLRRAVPRLTVSTFLVTVLCAGFVLLQGGVRTEPGGAAMTAFGSRSGTAGASR